MEKEKKISLKYVDSIGQQKYYGEVDESGELKQNGITLVETFNDKGGMLSVKSLDAEGAVIFDYRRSSTRSPFLVDSVSGKKRKAGSILFLAGYEI